MRYQLDDGRIVEGSPEEVVELMKLLAPPVLSAREPEPLKISDLLSGRVQVLPEPVVVSTIPQAEPSPAEFPTARRKSPLYFSEEEKTKIIREVEDGASVKEVAARNGVSYSAVYRWIKQRSRSGSTGRVYYYRGDSVESLVINYLMEQGEGYEFSTPDLAFLYDGDAENTRRAVSALITRMRRERRGIVKIDGHDRYRLADDARDARWCPVKRPADAQIKWDEENGY